MSTCWPGAAINDRMLHENDGLIVLHKPAGQAVIPGRGILAEETLSMQVEQYLRTKVYVVHRLNQATSGVILFAKDAAAHRDLNIHRTYAIPPSIPP